MFLVLQVKFSIYSVKKKIVQEFGIKTFLSPEKTFIGICRKISANSKNKFFKEFAIFRMSEF